MDIRNDPRFRTADGAVITPGLAVWDYNYELVVIDPKQFERPNGRIHRDSWDGSFDTLRPDGTLGKTFDGQRLSHRHWTTTQLASDALRLRVEPSRPPRDVF